MENYTATQWLAVASTSACAVAHEGGHASLGAVAFAGDVRLRAAAATKPFGFAIPAIRDAAGMAALPRTRSWSPPV